MEGQLEREAAQVDGEAVGGGAAQGGQRGGAGQASAPAPAPSLRLGGFLAPVTLLSPIFASPSYAQDHVPLPAPPASPWPPVLKLERQNCLRLHFHLRVAVVATSEQECHTAALVKCS
eukprot:626939-Hanusia_phi.AAC.1